MGSEITSANLDTAAATFLSKVGDDIIDWCRVYIESVEWNTRSNSHVTGNVGVAADGSRAAEFEITGNRSGAVGVETGQEVVA